MNREELIREIKYIASYAGSPHDTEYGHYEGHPKFYLNHSKNDFEKKLESVVPHKDTFDNHDLYYYAAYMFKYSLHPYDSHTRMFFINNKYLPIKIKFFDDIPYIVDASDSLSKYKGSKILKINGMDINDVIDSLDDIICYSSHDYFHVKLEGHLVNPDILESIPNMERTDKMVFTTDSGDITFDLNNLDKFVDKTVKPNYNLEINGDVAIITYNDCHDKDKMVELVNKLKSYNEINKYILDLRGNTGGSSLIHKPLLDYLKYKNVIVLSDERVFSAARMCLANFKKNGAHIIGKRPGTSINCFGECGIEGRFEDLNLRFTVSTKYFYYDDNLNCWGATKDGFNDFIKKIPNMLKPKFLDVDECKELTLDDYLNHTDSVMDYALSKLNNKKVR